MVLVSAQVAPPLNTPRTERRGPPRLVQRPATVAVIESPKVAKTHHPKMFLNTPRARSHAVLPNASQDAEYRSLSITRGAC